MEFDRAWAQTIFAACDPVFQAADVGFTGRIEGTDALLWEAVPQRFADRYPDSGIEESYGEEQWSDVPCIDYWIYVQADRRRYRLSVEGWNLGELYLDFTPSPGLDAAALASVFARILGVPWERALGDDEGP